MQQRCVSIYPEIGDKFQVILCVPDIDDSERIEEYVDEWIGEHLRFVDSFNIELSCEADAFYCKVGEMVDAYENEVEVYGPYEGFDLREYFVRFES